MYVLHPHCLLARPRCSSSAAVYRDSRKTSRPRLSSRRVRSVLQGLSALLGGLGCLVCLDSRGCRASLVLLGAFCRHKILCPHAHSTSSARMHMLQHAGQFPQCCHTPTASTPFPPVCTPAASFRLAALHMTLMAQRSETFSVAQAHGSSRSDGAEGTPRGGWR